MQKPRVAFIGTGGTIASIGRNSLELVEYISHKQLHNIDELLDGFPEVRQVADVVPVSHAVLQSHAIGPTEWLGLVGQIDELANTHPELDGVVVTHGTATLEETAYFTNLVSKLEKPIVFVGAQRPSTGISTDAAINLVNAAKVAGSPASKGLGVLVVLNDEIQAAREVTKTSTLRLQTFRTPDFGVLGHVDADRVAYYRQPLRRRAPDTAFSLQGLESLPRVDISLAYAGADGALIRAAVAAGARGIVAAGFAPGLNPPDQLTALNEAAEQGVVIVQGSRVGSGRVLPVSGAHPKGAITADNLSPQKARILLMLALTVTSDPTSIQSLFDEH